MSVAGGGRDRAIQDCTVELFIRVPDHLSSTHPSAVFLQQTTYLFFLNLFSTDEYFLHLPSTPSFHSFPFYSSPLSAPPSLFSALPFPLSSSLGPPARSFPRTACSQHSPPDWLLGFKGPHAPAKHMAPLHLRPDAVVSAATSPEAAHCTHIYNSSHAAAHRALSRPENCRESI